MPVPAGSPILSTKGAHRPEEKLVATEKNKLPHFPMIVMVNEHSASASEIVAGSLMDNHRAAVLGTRSYGKGSVQEVIPLEQNSGELKLTVAYYYLPSGRLVHKKKDATDWGVEPQIDVPMDDNAQYVVEKYQSDVELLHKISTTSLASQPATQPVADIQLDRAVQTLVFNALLQPTTNPAVAKAPTTRPANLNNLEIP
jgi:carboxyl-terminal processing protease